MTQHPHTDDKPHHPQDNTSGQAREDRPAPDAETKTPDAPTDLTPRSWWGAVKRTVSEFGDDNIGDWAAALTYYSVLSIFPAMLVIVSLVGLGGKSLTQDLITNLGDIAPGSVKQILVNALTQLQKGRGGASLVAVLSLAAAVWSASGYVGAFMRASNAVYDVPEGRPIWKTLPLRIAITVVTLVLLAASAIAVVVSGPLAHQIGDMIGFGSAAVTAYNIAKWPLMLVVINFLFALLYWAAPNAKQGFRWVTPGGILALVLWMVASAAFAFYVANFSSYNKTYGSLAGVIIFLVWVWITNIAILLGAELNAELERGRAIAAGTPENQEPYVEPRDTRKFDEEDLRDNDLNER
ncbi:YihY/virulence factor BrkB family protein [Actinomadura opuntiae]|uniref:YihY/virulence factor BrkB family protein n=1 Tax=Actinomadura sp. OS1-43 TaxID=604315 RepID=UPI00255B35D5|nr:YihY/virulence factor BrkB family protein [Actinomadura sp. OS1-43]MDL4816546.1 YihY/virulence factor BrkB family protein [Actinomadura sp. OS1-43]